MSLFFIELSTENNAKNELWRGIMQYIQYFWFKSILLILPFNTPFAFVLCHKLLIDTLK